MSAGITTPYLPPRRGALHWLLRRLRRRLQAPAAVPAASSTADENDRLAHARVSATQHLLH